MNKEEIRKVLLPGDQLKDELPEIMTLTAEVKRYIEVMIMIPDAAEEEAADPEHFRKKYGLSRDYKQDAVFFLDPNIMAGIQKLTGQEYLEAITVPAFRYNQFIRNKLYYREQLRTRCCVPEHEELKKWRERQMNRCISTAGTAAYANIMAPCILELSEGCSVGCEFCGFGAQKLKSVFRYTDQNAKLFDDVLDVMQNIMGQAAFYGAMYYCCEPLDNPDYEKFSDAFFKKSGVLPQVTTAVALRNPERTHQLLETLNSIDAFIYRFSVLNKEQAGQIFREFSPLELLKVELIPQYPEAAGFSGFASAGRARENNYLTDAKAYDSICCVSGFVINLSSKTVRMVTPVSSSDRFPTGEIIFDKIPFEDAEGLKNAINDLMRRFINNKLPRNRKLKLYDYITIRKNEMHGNVLHAPGYNKYLDTIFNGAGLYVAQLLKNGDCSAKEIVDEVTDRYGADPVDVYSALFYFWKEGLIDEFSEVF